MLWSNPPAARITPRRATMRVRCPCRCPIEASARQVQDGSSPRGRRSLQSSRGCQHQDLPRRRQGALHTTERATGLLIVGAARPQPRRPVVRLGRDRGHNPAARIPPASEGTCWSAARHRPSARVVLDRRPQRHSGGPFSSPEAARSPPSLPILPGTGAGSTPSTSSTGVPRAPPNCPNQLKRKVFAPSSLRNSANWTGFRRSTSRGLMLVMGRDHCPSTV